MKYVVIFFMIHLFIVLHPFEAEAVLVRLGNTVKNVTSHTSCKKKYWENKETVACQCCLVKKSFKLGGRFVYDPKNLQWCKKTKKCTAGAIEALKSELTDRSDASLVHHIAQKARLVQPVDLSDPALFLKNKKGLTTAGVAEMLRQLSTEGVLRHGAAFIDKCMHVQSFSDQNPGWFSTQLFGVFVKAACGAGPKDHLAYIIKEVAKKDVELKNLAVLSGSDLKRYDLTNPYRSKLFPGIAFNEVFTYYKDRFGKKYWFVVLTAAPGGSLFDFINAFAERYTQKTYTTDDLDRIQKVYKTIGYSLGLLHAKYMTVDAKGRLTGKSRAVHGDLHLHNIFISDVDQTPQATLIDIETMAKSWEKPQDVAQDLRKFYLFTAQSFPFKKLSKKFTPSEGINKKMWHEITMRPFLTGYVRAYVMQKGRVDMDRLEDVMGILDRSYGRTFGSRKGLGFVFLMGLRNFWSAKKNYLKPILANIKLNYLAHRGV